MERMKTDDEEEGAREKSPQIAGCADGAWNIIKLSNDDGNQFEIEAIEWKQSTFFLQQLEFFLLLFCSMCS